MIFPAATSLLNLAIEGGVRDPRGDSRPNQVRLPQRRVGLAKPLENPLLRRQAFGVPWVSGSARDETD